MTIAYLAAIRFPNERGHGIQIEHTVRALIERGLRVTMVVPTRTSRGHTSIPVVRIPCIDTVFIPVLGYPLLLLMFTVQTLWNKVVTEADVVYSRDAFALLPHVLLGRTCVYECHAPTRLARLLVSLVPTVVISKGLEGWVRTHGGKRVVYAPDAVDPRVFGGKRETPSVPTVVYAGTLYPRKGAWVLAEAAEQLSGIEVHIHGGPAKEAAEFEERYPSVVHHGPYPYTNLPDILSRASVIVIPNTKSDADAALYTSPMKLFEAMAAGVPIVASDVPALREVLSRDMAFFFTPEDPSDCARAIREALTSPEAKDKAKRAQEEVKRYTYAKRAEILDTYIRTI